MSKFKKQKKGLPPISTASLPDIIFMLLFFFMTVTTMRDVDYQIVQPELPKAKTVKEIQDKNLVKTIYIGKSKDPNIKGDVIQLDDKIANVSDVRSFILNKRSELPDEDVPLMSTVFKADKGTKVGTLADIKKELREIEALKIGYVASEELAKAKKGKK